MGQMARLGAKKVDDISLNTHKKMGVDNQLS